MIHLCSMFVLALVLALVDSSGLQNSERYLNLKVSDTEGNKVNQILVTCKEHCVPVPPVNGVIKLKLLPQMLAEGSITLEIVKHSNHPNYMIVSPVGGRVPVSSPDGKLTRLL